MAKNVNQSAKGTKANVASVKETETKKVPVEQIIENMEAPVETEKPKVVREKKSRFWKFDHLANVLKISEEEKALIKNYMIFALASRKSRVDFNEFAQEVLFKYSMEPEFKEKVESYK